MKEILLDKIIYNIKKNYNYDETKLKEIRYGLETLYLTIVKFIVIIIISFFIHTLKELCLLFVTYGVLRLTGFGLHTKKSIQCWIASILTFTIIPCLIKYAIIPNIVLIISSFLLLILISIYAPSDTEKRPLIRKKKRLIYKLLTITTTIIYITVIVLTKNFYLKRLIFFSILLEVLLVIPISYKLLGLKYNNYKEYKRKEDLK